MSSTSEVAPPSSSSYSTLQPPATASPTNASLGAAQACLKVLQASPGLSTWQTHGMLLGALGMAMVQGQGEAAPGIQSLQSLRDALDIVLGDGGSKEDGVTGPHQVPNEGSAAATQQSTSKTTSTTTVAAGPSGACAQVLQNPHLLSPIIDWLFHESHTLASRVALGQTALVNKEWQYISRQTCFWRPLVRALLPVVGDSDECMVQGRGHESYFACLSQYGKCLVQKQVKTGDDDVFAGLELHMEVWDAGVSSTRIYSAMGPIRPNIISGSTPEDPSTVLLRITGPNRKEVAGPVFSAADLDPAQRRYPTIVDCIGAGQQTPNPLHLCMRVTVTDSETGKMALIWQSGKSMKMSVNSCAEWVSQYLPEGGYYIRSTGWTPLRRLQADGSWSSGGQEELSAHAGFLLKRLPEQEEVDETEKKYVAAIVPAFHSSFGDIQFNVSEAKTAATFLRSLLE